MNGRYEKLAIALVFYGTTIQTFMYCLSCHSFRVTLIS